MTGQDFAQVKASRETESGSGSGALLRAIGVLVIAGLCFSAGYWLGSGDQRQVAVQTDADALEAKLAAQQAENRVLQAKNETLQEMVQQWKAKAEQGAHARVGELTFYNELPKQPVTPAPVPEPVVAVPVPVAVAPAQSTAPAESDHRVIGANAAAVDTGLQQETTAKRYRIQLASFRNEADAMTMQQKLNRAGFRSVVRMADLGDRGRWYRLYAGPFASRLEAESAQQRIEARMKLEGFLQRER